MHLLVRTCNLKAKHFVKESIERNVTFTNYMILFQGLEITGAYIAYRSSSKSVLFVKRT